MDFIKSTYGTVSSQVLAYDLLWVLYDVCLKIKSRLEVKATKQQMKMGNIRLEKKIVTIVFLNSALGMDYISVVKQIIYK